MPQTPANCAKDRRDYSELQIERSATRVDTPEISHRAVDAKSITTSLEESSDQRRIDSELIAQLYKQAPIAILGGLINATIVVFLMWNLFSHHLLLIWIGAVALLAVLRHGLLCAYWQTAAKASAPEWWGRLQVAGAGASGMLWGSTGIFLFPEGSTSHQTFIAFVLAGMVAGAEGTYSSVFAAFVAFAFPALVPIFVRFLWVGDDLHIAMAAMTLTFLVLTSVTARYISTSARELVGLKEHFVDKVAARTAELTRANEALNREIAEKEVLLKEVHHRVKNNLAVIIGLLRMQAARIVDPPTKEALQDCHERVKAMALVHETLYQSEGFTAIPLESYARALCDNLMQMMSVEQKGIGVQVIIEAKDVLLPIDQAMPCGLILNELLTNALKYAFPHGLGGQIHISAHFNKSGVFELEVRDNGVGLPLNFSPENCNTLGFRIISALVEHQMEGHWEIKNANGACFSIRWPPPNNKTANDHSEPT
jgi:two-component sensor histidine kinase